MLKYRHLRLQGLESKRNLSTHTKLNGFAIAPRLRRKVLIVTRIVFAFDKLDKSFTPVALLNPQMTVSGRPVAQCCEGYSLSMFETLEQLRKRARAGLDRAPNFLKRIGDHFVRIKLTTLDGIRTPSSSSGHFEFFEAVTFDGPSRSLAHARLFP